MVKLRILLLKCNGAEVHIASKACRVWAIQKSI